MNMSRVLIVEDNTYSGEIIVDIVKKAEKGIEVLWTDNVSDAYRWAMEYAIDVFIIDIVLDSRQANDVSGLGFARSIRKLADYKLTPLIFISSKQVPKLNLFQSVHCYSVLEKPIFESELQEALENILCKSICHVPGDFIDFRVNGVIYPISVEQIVYIEYVHGVLNVHATSDVLKVPYYSLKEVERKVDGKNFLRCSRTLLVNKHYISEIDLVNRYIRLCGDYGKLEIGSAMKKRLRRELGENN